MAGGLCNCTGFLETATLNLLLGRRKLVEGNEAEAARFLGDARISLEAMGVACRDFDPTAARQGVVAALEALGSRRLEAAQERVGAAVETFREEVRRAACAGNATKPLDQRRR